MNEFIIKNDGEVPKLSSLIDSERTVKLLQSTRRFGKMANAAEGAALDNQEDLEPLFKHHLLDMDSSDSEETYNKHDTTEHRFTTALEAIQD